MMAIVALLLAIAACCLAAPAAAWAGEVDLGISLSRGEAQETASGATGSLDLGIALGTGAAEFDNDASDGAVDIGIMLGAAQHSEVRFAGYYCDEGGSVVGAMETLPEVQRVASGGRAAEPADTRRTYEEGGSTVEYWLDGWYAADPSLHPGARPQALSDIEIDGDTVLYCLWKKGYVVKFDPNNGDVGDLAKGSVSSPGYVAVPRSADNHSGVAYADLPEATRPGYVFKGWYWAVRFNGGISTGEYGRAILDDKNGDGSLREPVVPPAGEAGYSDQDRLTYDFIHDNNGRTLFAKWELDPGTKVKLEGVRNAGGEEVDFYLWGWPGRGYVLDKEPYLDMDVKEPSAVIGGAGVVDLKVEGRPLTPYPTQYFTGWGLPKAEVVDGTYQDVPLIEYAKNEDTQAYFYRLTERAFEGDVPDVWNALFSTAQISVRAPFEVTFEKANEEPYEFTELECGPGDTSKWIGSQPQQFTNLGDRAVYISGIDCQDVGASAILPGGAGGAKIFSLYQVAGNPSGDPKAIRFGYAAASSANRVQVTSYAKDRCLELPAAVGGAGQPQTLYYGLDLTKAAFNRAAIAVGDSDSGDPGRTSYIAKVANVRYTYSVVP